jgi:hypothetical protein
MQSGTQAAREAGNMVDLDSNPTKLIEIVEIGKQLLMTRGSLTTFSIANDVAKYFAIIPALFVVTYPELGTLNVFGITTKRHSVGYYFQRPDHCRADPLALKGVPIASQGCCRAAPQSAGLWSRRIIVPFIGISHRCACCRLHWREYYHDRTLPAILILSYDTADRHRLSACHDRCQQSFFLHAANGSLTARDNVLLADLIGELGRPKSISGAGRPPLAMAIMLHLQVRTLGQAHETHGWIKPTLKAHQSSTVTLLPADAVTASAAG